MQFTLAALEAAPTKSVGQADSLKIETGRTRVWLCRCGIADGMPYDNQITVERLVNGRWITSDTFEGKPGITFVIED